VKNYIQKFKRVIGLAEQGFDVHTIGFLVKLSPALVEQYHQLYRALDMVAHRRAELKDFLKKSVPEVN
jgi:predicted transcriptional regulator